MASIYPTLQPLVKRYVKDNAGKLTEPGDYDAFIEAVLKGRYSQDRPLVKAADYAGDGSTYQLTLPAGTGTPAVYGWIDGFSSIVSVEYPTGDRPQTFLDPRDYAIDFISATTKKLILTDTTPGTGKTLRMRYTTQRVAEADVMATDADAFCKLAAAACCRALASYYAQTSDSTISADAINYRSKSQEYTSLAKEYEKAYGEHMGSADTPVTPGGQINWDSRLQAGYDYIWHPRTAR